MKYITHNKKNINVRGAFLLSTIEVKYNTLIKIFGEPTIGDEYKIDAEWQIKFEDGKVATIYNWKNGKNYLGNQGIPTENITTWHIGGIVSDVVNRIKKIIKNKNRYEKLKRILS